MSRKGPPSPAQQAATARNWRIRNLRALAALTYTLDRDLGEEARAVIDRQLIRMNAATIDKHRKAKTDKALAAEAESDAFDELPF